jgi:hypothetical protein
MVIVGGDFRKAGSRSKGEFKTEALTELLESDVKDLQSKGTTWWRVFVLTMKSLHEL